MAKNIVIPSNPADIKAIKEAVKEASNSMTIIDAEKDQIKEIIGLVSEKYELPKSYVSRLIKTFHTSDKDKKQTEMEDFIELYDTIMK